MLVQAVSPRPLVDFSREEVNERCPVCWETTEEDDGKLWCAHEHSDADLTDGTRIIVLVHPLHKDCAKITYLFQKDYTYLKDCIYGADVKIMSVMPIPRSIRESLGYALIRNAQTIALIVKRAALIWVMAAPVQGDDVARLFVWGTLVANVAIYHMQAPQGFFQGMQGAQLRGVQFFENDLQIIINDLGVRVILKERLRLLNEEAEEVVEGMEENI